MNPCFQYFANIICDFDICKLSVHTFILGRTCGHVGRADIIAFGRHNQNKFRKMGMFQNGIPSEATLCRVENGIDDLAMAGQYAGVC